MIKRVFDVLASSLAMLLTIPLWLAVSIAIKLESIGPVIHRSVRTGTGGRLFTLYKFRTMSVDASHTGPGVTRQNDARITKVGGFLRKLKVDELPQFINVLKGEMSIVGPRPEDPRFVQLYTNEQRRVFTVRPGLTGPAAIKYRHEEKLLAAAGTDIEDVYAKQIMPDKLRIDLEYIARRSFARDLRILVQTVVAIFKRTTGPRLEDGKKQHVTHV